MNGKEIYENHRQEAFKMRKERKRQRKEGGKEKQMEVRKEGETN